MPCLTSPISPRSGVFCSARCLGVASAILSCAGTLTHYALIGTGLPQLFAILGTCGIWGYSAILLNTTWLKEDGNLAELDLVEVRRRRMIAMVKSWFLFDLAATFVIVMPILASQESSGSVLARGVFIIRVVAFLCPATHIKDEDLKHFTDLEEARNSAPAPGSVAPVPEVVGRPADEPQSA